MPHRIFSTTFSPALDLSTWISPLDPLFAVALVTLVNYSVLAHPHGWIMAHVCNPKLFLHTWLRRLCRVSVPWTSWQIWMKQRERLKISTVTFSLCRSTDYTQHLVCVPVSVQLKSPGSNPGTATDPWCLQRAPSPATGHSRYCLKTFLIHLPYPLHDPQTHTLSWVPALQKAPGLLTAPKWNSLTSCTCGFPFLLFVFKPWKVRGTWSLSQVTRQNTV